MIPSHARPYVHLVGSVPLADAQQVFRAVCARLGPRLRRLPDGETGERANWIRCIQAMLAAHPAMEIDPATPPLAPGYNYVSPRALPEGTELILGLIHEGDAAGNRARLERARAVAPVAGIATECGWGRKNPERLPGLLESHILEDG